MKKIIKIIVYIIIIINIILNICLYSTIKRKEVLLNEVHNINDNFSLELQWYKNKLCELDYHYCLDDNIVE